MAKCEKGLTEGAWCRSKGKQASPDIPFGPRPVVKRKAARRGPSTTGTEKRRLERTLSRNLMLSARCYGSFTPSAHKKSMRPLTRKKRGSCKGTHESNQSRPKIGSSSSKEHVSDFTLSPKEKETHVRKGPTHHDAISQLKKKKWQIKTPHPIYRGTSHQSHLFEKGGNNDTRKKASGTFWRRTQERPFSLACWRGRRRCKRKSMASGYWSANFSCLVKRRSEAAVHQIAGRRQAPSKAQKWNSGVPRSSLKNARIHRPRRCLPWRKIHLRLPAGKKKQKKERLYILVF